MATLLSHYRYGRPSDRMKLWSTMIGTICGVISLWTGLAADTTRVKVVSGAFGLLGLGMVAL